MLFQQLRSIISLISMIKNQFQQSTSAQLTSSTNLKMLISRDLELNEELIDDDNINSHKDLWRNSTVNLLITILSGLYYKQTIYLFLMCY